jgi:exopolysaccharide biosynthesis protein
LHDFGADNGVNLDGGGSSTCAVRLPGSTDVTVVNAHPSGVAERAVANGIGVFAKTP